MKTSLGRGGEGASSASSDLPLVRRAAWGPTSISRDAEEATPRAGVCHDHKNVYVRAGDEHTIFVIVMVVVTVVVVLIAVDIYSSVGLDPDLAHRQLMPRRRRTTAERVQWRGTPRCAAGVCFGTEA